MIIVTERGNHLLWYHVIVTDVQCGILETGVRLAINYSVTTKIFIAFFVDVNYYVVLLAILNNVEVLLKYNTFGKTSKGQNFERVNILKTCFALISF